MDVERTCPAPDVQKQHIKRLSHDQEFTAKPGDSFFLISQKWWDMWKTYVNFDDAEDTSKHSILRPGPIDNTDLLENGELKRNLMEGVNYWILPASVWNQLIVW
jgi:ubiquitin carboxyl-terminal hydrolase 4/11/15